MEDISDGGVIAFSPWVRMGEKGACPFPPVLRLAGDRTVFLEQGAGELFQPPCSADMASEALESHPFPSELSAGSRSLAELQAGGFGAFAGYGEVARDRVFAYFEWVRLAWLAQLQQLDLVHRAIELRMI